jgi:hypothetical protein
VLLGVVSADSSDLRVVLEGIASHDAGSFREARRFIQYNGWNSI